MFGSILIDNEEANRSISKTEGHAEGLGAKLGSGIKTAAKWGAALGGAALAGGAAMLGMATKAAESTDRIDKLSQKIGLSRQGFQEWDFILSQSGTDIEKMQVGLKTLVQRMDEAEKGTGKGTEAFEKLNLSATDLNGNLKSQEQMFEEAAIALQGMEEGAEKSQLAFDLFGKAGLELMPMLNGASGSIEEMKQQASDLGLVISDDAIDAGVKFTDTVDQMKRSLGAIVTNIGAALIPIFQSMADWVIEHMPEIKKIFGIVFDAIKLYVQIAIDIIKIVIETFTEFFISSEESSTAFKDFFIGFVEWFKEVFELMKEFVKAALEAIKKFWDDHGEAIKAVVESIFKVLKVIIDTGMKVIKDIIKVITDIISGDWEGAWEGIKNIFVNIWEGMKELLPILIEGLLNIMRLAFDLFKDIGKNMFNMVWEGMKGIWESISSWVGEKVAWLADKLTFWKKSSAEMDEGAISNSSIDGSHAGGLAYVPYNGYVAELHKGERILTAEENKQIGSGRGDINQTVNIYSPTALSPSEIARQNKKTLQQLALQF